MDIEYLNKLYIDGTLHEMYKMGIIAPYTFQCIEVYNKYMIFKEKYKKRSICIRLVMGYFDLKYLTIHRIIKKFEV